jgi:hypothetical protein
MPAFFNTYISYLFQLIIYPHYFFLRYPLTRGSRVDEAGSPGLQAVDGDVMTLSYKYPISFDILTQQKLAEALDAVDSFITDFFNS